MKLELKLSHKGLILVSLPLAFELIFVAVLALLLVRSDQQVDEECHARAVIYELSNIAASQVQIASAIAYYGMTRKQEYLSASQLHTELMKHDMDSLVELTRNNKREYEAALRIKQIAQSALRYVDQASRIIDDGQRVESLQAMKKMRRTFDAMGSQYDIILEQERRVLSINPQGRIRSRNEIWTLLAVGLIFNIGLALFLAVYFNRAATRRLGVVMDNAMRFASNLPLNPRQPGTDEIAQLDGIFHEMAYYVLKASDKERAALHMMESMPIGIARLNEVGEIEIANQSLEETLGYKIGALKGKKFSDLYPQLVQKTDRTQSIHSKDLGRTMEQDCVRADGSLLGTDVLLTEFDTLEGKRILAIVIDATQRRELERLKQDFLAMVSHDLRAPLMSLQGFFEILQVGSYGALSGRGKDRTRKMSGELDRLVKLINDLLSLDKLESGKFELLVDKTRLSSVIERSVNSISYLAEERGIKITTPDQDCYFMCDDERLIQVLVNLLGNAIKFSDSGETVRIDATIHDQAVEISVTDRGAGIPDEFKDKIFERFQQVRRSDEVSKGGSGLGLAVARSIVERHGGEIGVKSEVGKGSTFWFRIPSAEIVLFEPLTDTEEVAAG